MKTLLAVLLLFSGHAFSQSQAGVILNQEDRTPVPFAKIGIEGRGIGTISDENGNFALVVNSKYGKDLIRFASPGYTSYSIRVTDYLLLGNKTILLRKKHIAPAPLKEVPATAKKTTYGVNGSTAMLDINGGLPGSEIGVLFNFKDSSHLDKLTVKMERFTVDTLFYRVNVYKNTAPNKFENILTAPIFYKVAASDVTDSTISIDLSQENIWVKGNKLITIEQLRNFGNGKLKFSGTKNGTSYARKASFAVWRTIPTTISMQVEASSVK